MAGASGSPSKIQHTVEWSCSVGAPPRRTVEKGLQVAFEGDEFGDLRADLVETAVQDLSDVSARQLAAVVDRQNLAHLL